ncbi:MAG: hypothetical protein MHMPM18_000800 [Marteilia pararefringens]
MEIKESYSKVTSLRKKRYDVDSIDSLFSEKCGSLFLVIAFISTLSQYVGTKIKCSTPRTLPESWFRYIDTSCWFEGTYYWPLEEPMASAKQLESISGEMKVYRYFAYFPMFYFVLAALLMAPDIFWRIMSNRSGIGLSRLLLTLNETEKQFDGSNSEIILDNLSFCLYRQALMSKLYKHSRYGRYFFLRKINYLDSRTGNYLTCNFLVKKYMYVLAFIFIQIYLNGILDNRFWSLGFDFLSRVCRDQYEQSKIFPLFVLCDFKVNYLSLTSYTFQCIVTRNIFMDGFITLTWFIVVPGLFISIYSAIDTTINLCSKSRRLGLIRNNLIDFQCQINKCEEKYTLIRKKDEVDLFAGLNLNTDIVFIVMMISKLNIHSNFTINRILNNLWLNRERFQMDYERKDKVLNDRGENKRVSKVVDNSSETSNDTEMIDANCYDDENDGSKNYDEDKQNTINHMVNKFQ